MEFPERTLTVSAFDPDLHNTGWARISVKWRAGELIPLALVAGLIQIHPKLRGLEATSVMIAEIRRNSVILEMPSPDISWVEAQEVYADGKADANDLLRLAQITGAIQLLHKSTPVLPKNWKGNKGKEGMHDRTREFLGDQGSAWESDYATRLRHHAWDAICLALWAAKQHMTNLDKKMLLGKSLPRQPSPMPCL